MIGTVTKLIPQLDGTVMIIETNANPADCEKLSSVDIKEHKHRRSIDANAYYWRLVGELARKLQITNSRCHNEMLRSYGILDEIDGKLIHVMIPDTDDAYEEILESSMYHLRPTTYIKDGIKGQPNYRVYVVIKGSSRYDTKEMSKLIDGVVQEAKEQDIEVLPPDEIERIKALWQSQ